MTAKGRTDSAPAVGARPRREAVSIRVDPDLLESVDRYVGEHPGLDRTKVVDEALRLWRAEMLRRARREQYLATLADDSADERAAWREIRRVAAQRFGLRG